MNPDAASSVRAGSSAAALPAGRGTVALSARLPARAPAGRKASCSTAGELLVEARRALAGLDSAALDASVLLAHVLAVPRTALAAHPERGLDAAERARFGALIARRTAGEPLAWLTGRREFRSLDLEVDRSTLVPRPETECLVEAALAAVSEEAGKTNPVRVADLGTGCGAVAVAIAAEAPAAELIATDIDRDALAAARRNVRRLAPGRVELCRGSWCGPIASGSCAVIASNPPYLREGDPHLLGDGVRHEPRLALVGGGDGLAAIRVIARDAGRCLRPGGRLLLEHGAGQGEAVRGLLRAAGFRRVETLRDLGGRERVTRGTRP